MPDMRMLLSGLEEYRGAIDRHLEQVRGEFDEVTRAWMSLSECFEGNAADEFRPVWESASERFRDYVEHSTAIVRILADRIEDLRLAEQTPGGLS
jgi:hypothetical protein